MEGIVSKRVLLVDDEPALRTAVGRMLRVLGYEALMASDGEEALALFKAERDAVAFVLLDLSLPRVGGREVFQALRAVKPGVPVLFSSGYECPTELLADPAVKFVRKPYALTELRGMVEKITA